MRLSRILTVTLVFGLPGRAAPAAAVQAGGGTAFVWADRPAAPSYTPAAAYTRNPGGAVRITRASAGVYAVQFVGLGGGGRVGGNVQVTAYGPGAHACQVERWSFTRPEFSAAVRCFDAGGRAADAPFSLLVVRDTTPELGYAFADQPAAAATYAPAPAYAHNGAGGPLRIARRSVGVYAVTLGRFGHVGAPGGNVQVTAYGTEPRHCKVESWSSGTTDFVATVRCFTAGGAPADARFSVLATWPSSGRAYAWTEQPRAPSYRPTGPYTSNPTGPVTITRSATGVYAVRFAGLGGRGSPGGNVQVTSYGPAADRCHVRSWNAGTEDFVVNVACHGATGAAADAPFSVHAIGPGLVPATQVVVQPPTRRISGFVDMHTHPMARWAFGGEFFWGDVDGDPAVALGKCQCFHRGWDAFANRCGNTYRETVVNETEVANAHHHTGDGSGYPTFQSFPKYDAILHQQMWHEWIRRAKAGGLAIMVALAVNSHALADAAEATGPNDDLGSMNLQLQKLREFVARHDDFMEIALSAADLRRIVYAGKLAVVVGIEMDNIGNFYDPADHKDARYTPRPTEADIRREIDRLYDLGVRYIFPIHITDNAFGGTALYQNGFNVANKYNTGAAWVPEVVDTRATGIGFKLESPYTAIDWFAELAMTFTGTIIPGHIMPNNRDNYPTYADPGPGRGHRNSLGLTTAGRYAVRYMMSKGMIIDVDHMSEKAVAEVLTTAESLDYPVNSGHNGPRGTNGNENQRTGEQYRRIRDLGGMIGLGHGGEATAFYNTLVRVLYATEGRPVAIGTDVNGLFPLPGPPQPRGRVTYGGGLVRSSLGSKTWDYNTDGFAHYGLFPEFIQSLRNAGMTRPVEDLFFGSAEAFTQMWEKAERRRTAVRP